MNRAYHKWFSTALQRDMELLAFGDRGKKVLFFPTRRAHFYDYENWGVISALTHQIESGQLHVICVDSIDAESFYSHTLSPGDRIIRHMQYEKYILEEVIPFVNKQNQSNHLMVAGCSLGAYHALNLAFRFPHLFEKAVGMSGRYDLTQAMGTFKDLFHGYVDENVYLNMPNRYIPHLFDLDYLEAIRKLKIILAVGETDAFLEDNRFLSQTLKEKGIDHEFNIWTGEAHNPDQWKQMVQLYF